MKKKDLKKSLTMPKNLKGGTLEGVYFWGNFFSKKSLAMPEKIERSSWYCMLRGNLFGSVPW